MLQDLCGMVQYIPKNGKPEKPFDTLIDTYSMYSTLEGMIYGTYRSLCREYRQYDNVAVTLKNNKIIIDFPDKQEIFYDFYAEPRKQEV